jgi:hypothetical protein
VKVSRYPVKVLRYPVEVSLKPVEVSREPVEVSRKPVEVSRKPVGVSREPVEVLREPVEVSISNLCASAVKSVFAGIQEKCIFKTLFSPYFPDKTTLVAVEQHAPQTLLPY